MHFFKYLCIFIFPIVTLAFQFQIPLGSVKDLRPIEATPEKVTPQTPSEKQKGDDVPLGDLLDSLESIKSMLDPEVFRTLDTIFRSAALALDQERAKKVKEFIDSANKIITPEFVQKTRRLFMEIARARR